jgi:hypothetical protein
MLRLSRSGGPGGDPISQEPIRLAAGHVIAIRDVIFWRPLAHGLGPTGYLSDSSDSLLVVNPAGLDPGEHIGSPPFSPGPP